MSDDGAMGIAQKAKANSLTLSRFQRIFRAAGAAAISNPRTAGLYAGVTATDNGPTQPTQTPSAYLFTPAAPGVWKATGGTPVSAGGSTRFYSAVLGTTGGTIGLNDGKNANFWRITANADCRYLALRVGATNSAYRLLVNGKYVDKIGTFLGVTTGTTSQYILYDFGTRATRTIALEGQGAAGFIGGYVEPEGKIYPVSTADAVHITYLGDSFIEGPIVPKGDCLAPIIGDLLGAYMHASGVGGTGWGRPTGAVYGLETRIANGDLALGGNRPDIIITGATYNNRLDTAAVIMAGVSAGLTTARQQYPGVPIVVQGCTASPLGPLTGTLSLTTAETAVRDAIAALNDPLIGFVPNITDPNGAWLTGIGSELTFTAPIAAASAGTLAVAWANGTVTYPILFSDGSTRSASFTQNSTAVTWTGGAVTASANANVSVTAGNAINKFLQDFIHYNAEGSMFLAGRQALATLAVLRAMYVALGVVA